MIITITGKPCSGKGAAVAKIIEKNKFEKFSAGDIFRRIATERGVNVLEINQAADVFDIDKLVDDEIVEIGKRDIDKDIIFDSRTAWHFIPNSFKVFLDIEPKEAARRLINSGRTSENVDVSEEEAIADLEKRWNIENDRYLKLYNFDNRNKNNYNLVVDTTNLTIEEVADAIMTAYAKFLEEKNHQ